MAVPGEVAGIPTAGRNNNRILGVRTLPCLPKSAQILCQYDRARRFLTAWFSTCALPTSFPAIGVSDGDTEDRHHGDDHLETEDGLFWMGIGG